MKWQKSGRKKSNWGMAAPLILFSLLFVGGPLAYLLILTFSTRLEGWGVSYQLTLENYRQLAQPVVLQVLGRSLVLGLLSTALVAVIGYPLGYYVSRLGKKGKRTVLFLLMVPFWVSSIIRLYGITILLRAGSPLVNSLKAMGLLQAPSLLNNYPAIVLGTVYALLPFMVLAVYSGADKINRGLVEAARDMGAGRFRAFITVTFPLSLPGLLSGAVLTLVPSMGLFYIAELLGGGRYLLVGNLIAQQFQKAPNWPFAAILSLVMLVLSAITLLIYRVVTRNEELEGLVQ